MADNFDLSNLSREQLLQVAAKLADMATEADTDSAPPTASRGSAKDSTVQRMAALWLVHARFSKKLSFAEIGSLLGVSAARVHQLYGFLVGRFPDIKTEE